MIGLFGDVESGKSLAGLYSSLVATCESRSINPLDYSPASKSIR